MGERSDEIRRDLGTGRGLDPLGDYGESGRRLDPAGPEEIEPNPALTVDETEATRAEIEQTRAGMSETVNAIQEKLSPQNLATQAKDTVREATVGKAEQMISNAGEQAKGTGFTIMDTIRQNPLPAALMGIGLGWMFMSGRNQGTTGITGSSSGASAQRALNKAQNKFDATASQSQYKAGQVAGQVQDTVNQVGNQAQDQISRLGTQAQDQASQLTSHAQDQVQRAKGGFEQSIQENPLAIGALALGVGAAIGFSMPTTSKENQLMGQARDNLLEKAQESAQDATEKLQRVAEEAQSTVKEEAKNQGLTDPGK